MLLFVCRPRCRLTGNALSDCELGYSPREITLAAGRSVNQSSVMAINISLQHRNGHGQIVDVDAATLKLISATCGDQLAVNFMDPRQQIIIRHMFQRIVRTTFRRQQTFAD